MPKRSARFWIDKLKMKEHPEGGYFAPAFRSSTQISGRAVVSSIYYLLEKGRFSTFHRLKSAEIWHFLEGAALTIHILEPDGGLIVRRLGREPESGESFQAGIEPGSWFAAEPCGQGDFSLVGCTVAPGFEWEDFEIARRPELLALYPEHREVIERLTR